MSDGTILVVDDEPVIRDIFEKILTTNSHYRILTASNGKEALEVCRDEKPDLVFTDIKMPVMDGMTFLTELRKQNQSVPVVIVSAHGEMEDVIAALRLGASNYLMKPNDISMLHSIAEKLLRVRKKERLEKHIYSYYQEVKEQYIIPNQIHFALPLIDIVVEKLEKMQLMDEKEIMNIKIALDEALSNAIIHGNLELSSNQKGRTLDDLIYFNENVKQRSVEHPYCDRRIFFSYTLSTTSAEFVIEDEGKGFQWDKIPKSFDEFDVLSTHGRGLVLIHMFMDLVEFNEVGNRIRMVKYFHAPKLVN